MSGDAQHNGWNNYETWAANLHIDNDQASQEYWADAARETIDNLPKTPHAVLTRRELAEFRLSDRLKDEHEGACPELEGVYQDLLNSALETVNWGEIARHMIDAAWTEEDDRDPLADAEDDSDE